MKEKNLNTNKDTINNVKNKSINRLKNVSNQNEQDGAAGMKTIKKRYIENNTILFITTRNRTVQYGTEQRSTVQGSAVAQK